MSFLYLFDKIDFDEKGNVCATVSCDVNHARSNYLYLLSKYNQAILDEIGLKFSPFFKTDLPDILKDVEKGGDFENAKEKIVSNCHPTVVNFCKNACNDKEIIANLNERLSIKDRVFASKFKKDMNNKNLEYIITMIAGKVFDDITYQIMEEGNSKDLQVASTENKNKDSRSKLFKDIIKYNNLVSTADKVRENQITVQDIQKMVG